MQNTNEENELLKGLPSPSLQSFQILRLKSLIFINHLLWKQQLNFWCWPRN